MTTPGFQETFDNHIAEEMRRYDEILEQLEANNRASELRHEKTERRLGALMQSMVALQDAQKKYHENPCPQLIQSVPEGDFVGHRLAHEALIQAAQDTRDLLKHIKMTVITAAVISVGGWLLLAAWAQFVKGPGG